MYLVLYLPLSGALKLWYLLLYPFIIVVVCYVRYNIQIHQYSHQLTTQVGLTILDGIRYNI